MEVHENPSGALSDGANALALKLGPILKQLVALKKIVAAEEWCHEKSSEKIGKEIINIETKP